MSRTFQQTLQDHALSLLRKQTKTLQVNVGLRCNLSCKHCHVHAGPHRSEVMTRETMAEVVQFADNHSFELADITGGAPELVPDIDFLIAALSSRIDKLMLRTNLTLLLDPSHEPLLTLCRNKKVSLVASFPSLNRKQADAQREGGVWEKSVNMLQRLNEMGYGMAGSGLELSLVANPVGAFLPVDQCQAEKKFRADLARKLNIQFTNLYTFANVPLGRFRAWLEQTGNLEQYLAKLTSAFNPATVDGLMCRSLISIGWDGTLYDCDFNLAAGLVFGGDKTHISELTELPNCCPIATDSHCFACTAGAGFT